MCRRLFSLFTIKNIKGTEITGTNTMVEKAFLESVQAGAKKEIVFTQKMSLQEENICFPRRDRI